MNRFPKSRRAVWRLKRAIMDLRLAIAEAKVAKLQHRLNLIDLEGCNLTVDEL